MDTTRLSAAVDEAVKALLGYGLHSKPPHVMLLILSIYIKEILFTCFLCGPEFDIPGFLSIVELLLLLDRQRDMGPNRCEL